MPILHWLNKDQSLRVVKQSAYRLLEEVPELSYGNSDNENLLIQGDNLEALKALVPFYTGKVNCIYIDPPYNTKSAFEHYDDSLEHSQWLSLLYPRLEILHNLLAPSGSIWISIDNNESHYLKVICDEIFGRKNFLAEIAWQKRTSPDVRATISDGHESVIVFAKEKEKFKLIAKKIPKTAEQIKKFKNPDNDPRGVWVSSDYTAQGFRPNQMYEIKTPSGKFFSPPDGVCWKNVESVFDELMADNRIWFGKNGNSMPRRKTFLSEGDGQTPWTWWPNTEVGHTQESKKEIKALFGSDNVFDTPKPERLIERILHIATDEGELVLDSFLGSGTTAAVAHKMNRRFVGIEIGDHAQTHCQPRLQKVVDGEQGGISKSVNWKGGGGFRFCKLGETVFDEFGCLNAEIKFPALAAYIWYLETKMPMERKQIYSPFLGIHNDTAYYLLYNGILGDKRPNGGNVLTSKVLVDLPSILEHKGKIVIFGETTRLGATRLSHENIVFKQIPYDVSSL